MSHVCKQQAEGLGFNLYCCPPKGSGQIGLLCLFQLFVTSRVWLKREVEAECLSGASTHVELLLSGCWGMGDFSLKKKLIAYICYALRDQTLCLMFFPL